MIENLDWIAATLAVIGSVLVARKVVWCFPIWIISNILFILWAAVVHRYAFVILDTIYIVINIDGWLHCSKENHSGSALHGEEIRTPIAGQPKM